MALSLSVPRISQHTQLKGIPSKYFSLLYYLSIHTLAVQGQRATVKPILLHFRCVREILLAIARRPSINIPRAILAQFAVGFSATLLYVISILYSIMHPITVIEKQRAISPSRLSTGCPPSAAGGQPGASNPVFLAPFYCLHRPLPHRSPHIFDSCPRQRYNFLRCPREVSINYQNPANAILLYAVLRLPLLLSAASPALLRYAI